MPDARQSRSIAAVIGLGGASAVLLGAAGAHLLALDAGAAELWRLALGFQFWHVLAFALAALAAPTGPGRRTALWAFAVGIVCFCGSLYGLALAAQPWLGVLTPFGGVALVVGWLALAASLAGRRLPYRTP